MVNGVSTCVWEYNVFVMIMLLLLSGIFVTVKSKLVLECLECLSELATHNSIQLVWVPGHKGVLGNERAGELAKKGTDTPFTEPEPVLGLPYSMVKRAIGD